MKILITTGIFPPDIGGPATQLDWLIKDLLGAGFLVEVITFTNDIKAVKRKEFPVVGIDRNISRLRRSIRYFFTTLKLAARADILYTQDLYTAGFSALAAAYLWRKPLVARFVGDSAWEKAWTRGEIRDDILTFQTKKYSFKIELAKKIRALILKKARTVIVVSFFLKEVAKKIGVSEKKIKVIYNSVDFIDAQLKTLENSQDFKNKIGIGGRIILSAGRLAPWKGMSLLIKIMPEILNKYPDIKLLILGDGPEYNNLKNSVTNLGLENKVMILTKIRHPQILNYYNVADIFILNSNYEGMSHIILEALKFGLPIVTTDIGGNPETVKDKESGLLVEFNNEKQIKEALIKLIEDENLRKRLANNAKKQSQKFNWQNLVKETIEIFKKL